jgi:hypothetical protein
MAEVSNEVEREKREDENRNDLFVAWSLILARLDGAAGGAVAVTRDTGGGLAVRRAAEEREARGGLQLAMRHERHPGERQHQSEHCSKRQHG